MDQTQLEILKMAVMWYGVDMLPRLRQLAHTDLHKVLDEAQALSFEHPLHLCREAEFILPTWDPQKKLSGGQVVALMVFGLWVLCGEDEKQAGALLDRWPIREAVFLCQRPQ